MQLKKDVSDLPDQISNCVSVPNGVKEAKAQAFSTVESLIKSKSASLGVSDPTGVSSMSATARMCQKTMAEDKEKKRSVSEVTAFASGYR